MAPVPAPDFVCSVCHRRIPKAGQQEQTWWTQILDHWILHHPEKGVKA